ncbi:MAG: 1-acyl-sn-glycerol-3-phosphate acyltransferase [Acidobacteriota bacterium]
MKLWLAFAALLLILAALATWLGRRSARAMVHSRRLRVDRFKLRKKHTDIRFEVFSDPEVVEAIRRFAKEKHVSLDSAQREARLYLAEIVPKFNLLAYYRFGAPIARALLNSLYRVAVERRMLRSLSEDVSRDSVVVYIINHRSNADYLLVAHMLFKFVSLSYAVGEWARVWPLNHLFKWFGGYFVRRRYREPLYHAVLRSFVQTITRNGVIQGVFIEGGLTRDGAFRKPKLGMLDYLITSKGDKNFKGLLYLVPTAINYDRVLEDRSLIQELMGKEDRASKLEKLQTTLDFLFKNALRSMLHRFKRYGNAVVSFGEPLLVDELVAADPLLIAPDFETRKESLQRVADRLMSEISAALPVTPVPAVAAIFRAHDGLTLSKEEIIAAITKMREETAARMWIGRSPEQIWESARRILDLRHLVEPLSGGWRWVPNETLLRDYYANSLLTYEEVRQRGWPESRREPGSAKVEAPAPDSLPR